MSLPWPAMTDTPAIRPDSIRGGSVVVGHDAGEPVEMQYLEQGEPGADYTLLLLHGLFDHKGTWGPMLPHLDQRFRLIAPDLVGFGRSSKPRFQSTPVDERYTVDMHAGYLREFVAQLGLDHFVLVGNSLGGGVALRLLCTPWRGPTRPTVRGLVLIDAAGYAQSLPGYIQEMAGWAGALIANPLGHWLGLKLGLIQATVRRTARHVFHDPSRLAPEVVDEAIDLLRDRDTVRAYRLAARNLVPADIRTFPDNYRNIDCPTLIVWGQEDRIVPALFALRFEADIPGAKLHVFQDCGHAPHIEYAAETAILLRDWARHNL